MKKLILIFLFLIGFFIDPFAKNTKSGALRFSLLILFLVILAAIYLKKRFSGEIDNFINSKILIRFIIFSFFPIFVAVLYWKNWYDNLFDFQNSILIFVVFALIAFFLANIFQKTQKHLSIFFAGFFGVCISAFLHFIFLIFNHFQIIEFPNILHSSFDIVNNALVISILCLILGPNLFQIYKKQFSYSKPIFFISQILSLLVLIMFFDLNVFLILLVFMIISFSLKIFQKYYNYYIFTFGLIVVLGLLTTQVIEVTKEFNYAILQTPKADLRITFETVVNALFQNNPLFGYGNISFLEILYKYLPQNPYNDFINVHSYTFSSIWDLIMKFGFLILIPLAMFFISSINLIYKNLKENISFETQNKNLNLKSISAVILLIFLLIIIFGTISFGILLLSSLAIVFLSFDQKNLDRNKKMQFKENKNISLNLNMNSDSKEMMILFNMVAILLIPLSLVFLYGSIRIITADYMYGRGVMLYQSQEKEDIEEALSLFTKASKINDKEATYYQEMSIVYYGIFSITQTELDILTEEQQAEVKKYFDNIRIYSNNAIAIEADDYYIWLKRFSLMKNLSNYADTSEPINAAAERLFIIAPKDSELMLAIAAYYTEEKQDIDIAMKYIQKAYEVSPYVNKVILEYGKGLGAQGQYKDAIEVLSEIRKNESLKDTEEFKESDFLIKKFLKKVTNDSISTEKKEDGS